MTLRKITVDKSVKYFPQSDQWSERDMKPNMIKNNSLPNKNKTKIFHKILKNSLKIT